MGSASIMPGAPVASVIFDQGHEFRVFVLVLLVGAVRGWEQNVRRMVRQVGVPVTLVVPWRDDALRQVLRNHGVQGRASIEVDLALAALKPTGLVSAVVLQGHVTCRISVAAKREHARRALRGVLRSHQPTKYLVTYGAHKPHVCVAHEDILILLPQERCLRNQEVIP